jgi:hypothetical protein
VALSAPDRQPVRTAIGRRSQDRPCVVETNPSAASTLVDVSEDVVALMGTLSALSERSVPADRGPVARPAGTAAPDRFPAGAFEREPPDADVVEAAVGVFVRAAVSTNADAARSVAAYERFERLLARLGEKVAAGGPHAGDWLDVTLYLGDQAVAALPRRPARLRISLLSTLSGFHLDHADPADPEWGSASPHLALRYCGQSLELLDDIDEPAPWLAPLFFLVGRAHAMVAAAGRADAATAAAEAVRALTYAADATGSGRDRLRALALIELARVHVDRGTVRHEAFEDEPRAELDYPQAIVAYRRAVAAADEATAAGVDGAVLTGRIARLELADVLVRGLASPRSPDWLDDQGILDPPTVAEVGVLLTQVLSADADGPPVTDYERGWAHDLRCDVARDGLGRLAALPAEPGPDQRRLVTGMLADLAVATASFERAGLGLPRILPLRLKAGVLAYYGLRDADAALPWLRDCHRELARMLRADLGPAELTRHKAEMHMVYRLLAQIELDRGHVEEAFAVSTSALAAFANRRLADVDRDTGAVPPALWERFVDARRSYGAAVEDDIRTWFAVREGREPTGRRRETSRTRAAARRTFDERLAEIEAVAPDDARRLRGDGRHAADVAGLLAPGQALVELHPLADQTVAYVVTAEATTAVAVGPGFGEAATLERPLRGWLSPYDELRRRGIRDVGDFEKLRAAFADTFGWFRDSFDLTALADCLTGVATLFVVAHHPLGFVPLPALPLPDGRCLLDKHDVRLLPSVNFLRGDPPPAVTRDAAFTGVSDPRPTPPYHLSYSACETAAVAAHFWAPRLLPGPAATGAAVLAAVEDSDVTHLSCHGSHRYIFGSVYQSELILAGQETLRLAEFFRHLSPARHRLVVLSACDSGAGDPRGVGDEVLNFPTGLLTGGVHAVVTTTWQVEERATLFLVHAFYKHLTADGGQPPARALRKAQRWLRSATGAELADLAYRILATAGPASAPGLRAWADRYRDGQRGQRRPYADPFFWSAFALWG